MIAVSTIGTRIVIGLLVCFVLLVILLLGWPIPCNHYLIDDEPWCITIRW